MTRLPRMDDHEHSRRPMGRATLLVALGGTLLAGLLVGLGLWQVERLHWKVDLIDRVEARVRLPPIDAPSADEWAALDPAGLEYRPVRLQGRFLHDAETRVQALTEHGGGHWVMTPLVRPDGETILVNRGFVPPERMDPATRLPDPADESVEITGLLRLSEPGGDFLRSNDPQAGRWFSRDVAAIAKALDIPRALPFFVDADTASGTQDFPVGGLTVLSFRNPHLGYAITWFALAAMVVAGTIYIVLDDRRRRRTFAEREQPALSTGTN